MLQWTLGKNCVVTYNALAEYLHICCAEITMHKSGSVFAKHFAKGAQMFYFGEPGKIGKAEVTGLGKNEARVPWLQGRKKLADNSELKLYFHQGEHVLRHCAAGLYRNS